MNEVDVGRAMADLRRDVASAGGLEDVRIVPKTELLRSDLIERDPKLTSRAAVLSLADFLQYDGMEFIDRAYRAILGRGPDSAGREFYMNSLQAGRLTKVQILYGLQSSEEAKAAGIVIPGLARRAKLQRVFSIPVLGYLLRMLRLIVALPRAAQRQQAFENFVRMQLKIIDQARSDHATKVAFAATRYTDERAGKLERRIGEAEGGIIRLRNEWNPAHEALVRGEARVAALVDALDTLRVEVIAPLEQYRLSLLDQERRLTILLDEVRSNIPAPPAADKAQVFADEGDKMLDRLYMAIEDRFRGTREDIRGRQAVYLPEIRRAVAGEQALPVLDIGCGRGEWLELLGGKGIAAIGLDMNRTMVDSCNDLGLTAVEGEALAYLRACPPGSFSAITGFHIIEHVPFRVLISLIDESLRALKPGGMLLFETPNPDNVLVGSNTFYTDPTHIKPLPSNLVAAMVEERGFASVEVRGLHPRPEIANVYEQPVLNEFNYFFYGPQDYAVIAWKASD